MMLPDYHMHTSLCKHATGVPAEYAAAAAEKGLDHICITDHAPSPTGYDDAHRMAMEDFPIYREWVQEAQLSASIPVLWGIEADYYDGAVDFLPRWLDAQDFDLVIGSIHYLGDWGFDNPDTRAVWDFVDVPDTWREYFHRLGELADTGLYNIVGHIDLPKKFGYRPHSAAVIDMAKPALDRIANANMAIEINTSGLSKTVGEMYNTPDILALACDRDIPITFGSDAHAPNEVAHAFDLALAQARDAGYTHHAVFSKRQRTLKPLPENA